MPIFGNLLGLVLAEAQLLFLAHVSPGVLYGGPSLLDVVAQVHALSSGVYGLLHRGSRSPPLEVATLDVCRHSAVVLWDYWLMVVILDG